MATIGQQLAGAREKAEISIEDAAHDTRIHANILLSIEEDDFSMFPSVAYARSFIRNYSEYLEVDLSREMQALDSSVTGRLSENELMNEMKKTIKKESRFRLKRTPGKKKRRPVEKAGGAPLLLNLLLLLLVGALGIFYFLGFKASTPEEARVEITNGLNRVNIFSDGSNETAEPVIPRNPLNPNQAEVEQESPAVAGDPLVAAPAEAAEETTPEASEPRSPAIAKTEEPVIVKPDVDIDLQETPDLSAAIRKKDETEAASRLRPRGAADLSFSEGEAVTPSIRSEDMPEVLRNVSEPAAVLRPEGTSPASPTEADAQAGQSSASVDTPALRALPVRP